MEKLKACPFCGGEPHIKLSWVPKSEVVAIGCGGENKCPAKNDEQDEQGGFSCDFYELKDAVINWNTRPIEDALNAEIARLTAENARLTIEVEESNGLLRSAYQIARRDGNKTNWEAWRNKLHIALVRQHEMMYPKDKNETSNL